MKTEPRAIEAKHYIAGGFLGLVLGVLLLHPFTMVLGDGLSRNYIAWLTGALVPVHLEMNLLFGAMGLAMGVVLTLYHGALTRSRAKVMELEGLIPICSYCKSIRDDTGVQKGEGTWHGIENFITSKTGAEFTHGICPDCYERVMDEDGLE